MSRRRQTPWLHRWSRPLIASIALLGALNTGYLTATKLFGGEAACPTNGCEQVLASPYATIFGLPLALFGFLAYVGMATFALAPLAVKPEANKQLRGNLENWTWLLLFAGSTAMMVFSGYLMYIMATEFVIPNGLQSLCYYCVVSAIFATTLFVLTLLGRTWDDVGQLFFTGVVVGMLVLVGSLGVYANVNNPAVADGGAAPEIPVTNTSGEAEIALARHLKSAGAVMYGAYWCSHCYEQKMLFGREAAKEFNYVECSPDGVGAPQAEVCQTKGVQGYPTWEINGEMVSGTLPLNELADKSGYTGSREFKN